ncbi:MAG: KH domain-containing protein [Bacilli bacterium]|nr:KH domain-containing protein [Bacilli bacterium]
MEKDYDALLRPLIAPLVEKPESIMIRTLPGETKRDVTVLIVAEDDDTARLIGKKGQVANALREVVGIAPKAENSNLHIHLKFESFSEETDEE